MTVELSGITNLVITLVITFEAASAAIPFGFAGSLVNDPTMSLVIPYGSRLNSALTSQTSPY